MIGTEDEAVLSEMAFVLAMNEIRRRERISQALRGRILPESQRQKMRESHRRRHQRKREAKAAQAGSSDSTMDTRGVEIAETPETVSETATCL